MSQKSVLESEKHGRIIFLRGVVGNTASDSERSISLKIFLKIAVPWILQNRQKTPKISTSPVK